MRTSRSVKFGRLPLMLVMVVIVVILGTALVQISGVAGLVGGGGIRITYLTESFTDDVATGWGSTDVPSVPWTPSSSDGATWSVAGGVAVARLAVAGASRHQSVEGLGAMTDQEVTGRVRVDTAAAGVDGHQALVWLRFVDAANAYRAVLFVPALGNRWGVRLDRIVDGRVGILSGRVESDAPFGRNGYLRFRVRATGVSPTRLAVRVWPDQAPEPSTWTATADDVSQVLQRSVTAFRVTSFVDPDESSFPVTMWWDDFSITNGQ